MRVACRGVVSLLVWCGIGTAAVAAVEESQMLAWAGAGEELGGTLACHGLGAVLGAPGGSTSDRFFLGTFDPQTGLWTNIDEAGGGNSFVELAMDGATVAAILDDAVSLYGWGLGGLGFLDTVNVGGGGSPRAVAVDNNILAVGSHHNTFPVPQGLVSIYTRSMSGSWDFEDSFSGVITFGWALAIDGTELVVGQQGSTAATGNAWLYSRSAGEPYTWESAGGSKQAPDGELNNSFGRAVALDGDSLAVGAPLDDHEAISNAGSVHLYRRNCGIGGYLDDGVLISPNPIAEGRFGASVALRGRDLVVGEPGAGGPSLPQAGVAHLYRRGPGGWTYVETLTRFMAMAGAELGTAVCIAEHGVLVGAPMADRMGIDSGLVLFYRGLNTLFANGFECGSTGDWSLVAP